MVSCLPRQGLKGGSFAHVHLASDSRIQIMVPMISSQDFQGVYPHGRGGIVVRKCICQKKIVKIRCSNLAITQLEHML